MSTQWYFAKWVFVENGETRKTVFNAVFVVPNWLTLVNYINYFLTGSLADGLLVRDRFKTLCFVLRQFQFADMAVLQRLESFTSRHIIAIFSAAY